MNAFDVLSQWVLPLLLYGGAVAPLGVALMLDRDSERHRRHWRLFIVLFTIQAVSFLPFIVALLFGLSHAIHGLLWPALVGVVLFVWGIVILVSECIYRMKPGMDGPIAEPSAGPNERERGQPQ